MKSLNVIIGITAALAAASASEFQHEGLRSDPKLRLETPSLTPKRFIVELESTSCSERVKGRVSKLAGLRVVKTFDHDLFPALSIECEHGCDADTLGRLLDPDQHSKSRDVAAVYKPSTLQLRLPEEGESFSDDAAAPKYSFHGLTGVEDLHKAGIFGEGATVAIVDSGVEWTHPDLGNGFGPGHTVIGGYDLVGDGNWPDTAADPDEKPNDQFGHGTHVAGIVAGKGKQFVGVAPGAKILSYKIMGSSGQSDEEMVIEGFLKAFDSGADIITASLGEKSGWPSNAWATLASRMVDKGVFVSIAGGNDGDEGAFLMSNGAAGKNVMTVAAADPDLVPVYPFSASFIVDDQSDKSELGYAPAPDSGSLDFFPDTIIDWAIVPLSLNTSVVGDACKAIPDKAIPNVDNSIVLVRAGGCTLAQKTRMLSAAKVPYVLYYQDSSAYQAPGKDSSGRTHVGVIDAKAGEAVVEAILAGGNVTASFNESTTRFVGMRDTAQGRPAIFTQWGPNNDVGLKPDIMAPGAKVLSTYIGGGYKILSGTSMATPYVAGVAALYVGKHGGRKAHASDPDWAKRLMSRIMSTAESAPWVDEWTEETKPEFRAPPVQVGAGLLNARRVLGTNTTLSFEGRKFELNDTAHFQGRHSVEITNAGPEKLTYSFSLEKAASFDSWKPARPNEVPAFGENSVAAYFDYQPYNITPEISMPSEVAVHPGESATVKFEFSPPDGVNASRIPIYGGRVLIHASNGEVFGIPYAGAAADINEVIPGSWDRGASLPNMISGPERQSIQDKTTLTFDLGRDAQDFPLLVTQSMFATREVRWDIFESGFTEEDWQYPPQLGQKGYVGSATSWTRSADTSYFDPERDDASDVVSFPFLNIPRGVSSYHMWLGQLANGSQIQPGHYEFRVAALRPFGDPKVARDWDVWKTPEITVLPRNSTASKQYR